MKKDYTPTYILTWNPKRFDWLDYYSAIKTGDMFQTDWTCHTKQPEPKDKFIMLMQGMGKLNGIVAAGRILGEPYYYWGQRYVDIKITYLWDYRKKHILAETLRKRFPEQCFTPRSSGIRIKSRYLPDLWRMIDNS